VLALCPQCGKLRRECVLDERWRRRDRNRYFPGWLHGTCNCCCNLSTYYLVPCCANANSICFDGDLGTFSVGNVVLFGSCCYTITAINEATPDTFDHTIDPDTDFTLQANCSATLCGCCPSSSLSFRLTFDGVDPLNCGCISACWGQQTFAGSADGVYNLTRTPSTSCIGTLATPNTMYQVNWTANCAGIDYSYGSGGRSTGGTEITANVEVSMQGNCNTPQPFRVDVINLIWTGTARKAFRYRNSAAPSEAFINDLIDNQLTCTDGSPLCGVSDSGTCKVELV
jgi:hypothetical protein